MEIKGAIENPSYNAIGRRRGGWGRARMDGITFRFSTLDVLHFAVSLEYNDRLQA